MAKITYEDKVSLVARAAGRRNKATAEDLNEIKEVVNELADIKFDAANSNQPGAPPLLNEEGAIPAVVQVRGGTAAELDGIVLKNKELAVEFAPGDKVLAIGAGEEGVPEEYEWDGAQWRSGNYYFSPSVNRTNGVALWEDASIPPVELYNAEHTSDNLDTRTETPWDTAGPYAPFGDAATPAPVVKQSRGDPVGLRAGDGETAGGRRIIGRQTIKALEENFETTETTTAYETITPLQVTLKPGAYFLDLKISLTANETNDGDVEMRLRIEGVGNLFHGFVIGDTFVGGRIIALGTASGLIQSGIGPDFSRYIYASGIFILNTETVIQPQISTIGGENKVTILQGASITFTRMD